MAIYGPKTYFVDSVSADMADGATVTAEGVVLVRNGANGLQPSTAATTEVFAGFATAQTSAAPFAETFAIKVEVLLVPSTGILTLDRTPVTGQVGLFDVDAGTPIAVTSPVVVTGNSIAGLTAGDTVRATYKFPLTAVERRTLYGDVQPGGYSGDYVGQIGQAKRGVIYTNEFDASKNYAAATSLKSAAGGQVTDQTGTGSPLTGVVVSLPSVEFPFLGIEFSAV